MDRLIAGKPRIRKLFESLEHSLEDEEHLKSLADNTRLNARQAPSLYRLVEDVAASARMPTPRVFLDTQPEVNAWALGQRNPMIVLTSALVDEFTDAEIRAVVAHELGHIRCQHTFYRLVSQGFDPIAAVASALPGGSLLALALRWHLMDWFRKSELSSDRFSLLVTGDLETVQKVILKLAGGASSLKDELSNDEFRLQAKEFRDTVEARKRGSFRDKIEYYTSSLMLQDAMNTHPWPAIRFVEIEDWAKSRQYSLIADGDLVEAERYPFQFIPETAFDADLDAAELTDPLNDPEPVLRQAASEIAGKWKARTAKFGAKSTE
ncbi:M48 family metallopeptidase [Mycobacterium sp. NPDC051804]|uniref:M48 family metallopeptidase n=1 Tax=Mycobacterium sp. NPDC051804 TaxID=3364295 RepID=UPI003791EE7D